ncbi:MAG: cphA [Rickettsiaceae bacterium]|jgi:cyanophycin synthetase|nr:cphA [Rickettsiaceae bacterium]
MGRTAKELPSLKVQECRIYRGPHLYSHTPMIRIQVDLGILEEYPTNKLPDFTPKLLEILPDLAQHKCSTGKPGGFVSRLKEGTWLGHVIEHVAIELQFMAGMAVTRGKTRSVKGKPGYYNIMYAYIYEDAGLLAGRLALDLVASALPSPFNKFTGLDKVHEFGDSDGFNLEEGINELKYIFKSKKFGPTTQAIIDEAQRRNISWKRLDNKSLVMLGTGKYQKIIRSSITSNTSNIAVETASDKDLTKNLLSNANIPVPLGYVVKTLEGALETFEELGVPVTVKPLDSNHGHGVSTALYSDEEVTEAFGRAKEYSNYIIVEKHFTGRDYRVLIVNGEMVAAAERVPAHVIGNGVDTIAKLIEEVNEDPHRGEGHEDVLTRIVIDETLTSWIARSNLTLESIPDKGQKIILSPTANLSTGGTAVDCTDDIHPDNASIARRAALTIGLDIAGIDMILPDIEKSWTKTGGGIIEVNASPGFRMHLHPAKGLPRNVAKPVISGLFPPGAKTQIPVVGVTGTNGKSTTVKMLAHILRQAGMRVGYTSTSGIFINDDCIWKGDASGPKSAALLLKDPTIDIAILETARGGIVREGLGVMELDVGAVLNITADHLGISGIDTLEDLAAVKSVVTETVHSRGVSVINADDPLTLSIAKYAGGDLCYFSMQPAKSELILEHLKNGGRAVTREIMGGKAHIVLNINEKRIPIACVDEIPATHFGVAKFNIENALAATAIASALNIDPHIIKLALNSFTSSYEQNPGRFNIHDEHGFRVIMDYAHNPAALKAFFDMIREMRKHYMRVIGHISTPGDRRDEDIIEVGRIAGKELDIVIFREKPDTRGRPEGEILKLLKKGALLTGCSDEKIICVHGEDEATEICLQKAQRGDLIILTPSDIEDAWKKVVEYKPNFTEQNKSVRIKEKIHATYQ